ncbi:hypothetical protein RvY_00204 [Ramazzottius varieornatus]|uniref:Uncharacterized protein n=1 Tax=Ramazzottius varieornatus TaxID=947166 RepID=A0A1D1ULW0_RAMVA|nr:hypothetical protein RvY_00204 [Ramazzottius varieornatus]
MKTIPRDAHPGQIPLPLNRLNNDPISSLQIHHMTDSTFGTKREYRRGHAGYVLLVNQAYIASHYIIPIDVMHITNINLPNCVSGCLVQVCL